MNAVLGIPAILKRARPASVNRQLYRICLAPSAPRLREPSGFQGGITFKHLTKLLNSTLKCCTLRLRTLRLKVWGGVEKELAQTPQSEKLLLIERDDSLRSELRKTLAFQNFSVDSAPDGESGLALLRSRRYGVAIVELFLPGISGFETISRMAEISPRTEVISFNSEPNLDSAPQTLGYDVFDHLANPISTDRLVRSVSEAFETFKAKREQENSLSRLLKQRSQLERRIKLAEEALQSKLNPSQLLLGQSESIQEVRRQIALVAPTSMTVLITGESGSGKDVVANLIHNYSGRAQSGRMVKVNCPAVPDALIESELFGHEDGSFTGAIRRRPGRFDLADGGSIFLDEVGAMSLAMQAKLLQAIEHKKFTRVGGDVVVEVDARILAATNTSLQTMIEKGLFRTDLFYRLNQFTISLPPLRHRREDIPILVECFLKKCCLRYSRSYIKIHSGLNEALMQYNWPGNVRELHAAIERFALTGDESTLHATVESPTVSAPAAISSSVLEDKEASTVLQALIMTNWNRRRAAHVLGISYSAVRRRIQKYDLSNSSQKLKTRALDV